MIRRISMFKRLQNTVIPKLAIAGMLLATLRATATEKTLVSFNWLPAPNALQTGAYPSGTMLRDANGNLYGTNWLGGEYDSGTVFRLSPPGRGETEWKLSILYTFTGWDDGGLPNPQLVMDASGALYGTAEGGGSWMDQGLVYKLTPPVTGNGKWTFTVLHYFYTTFLDGPGDGSNPSGGLIMDKSGNLYGTTDLGGDPSDPQGVGSGTVFKLAPTDAARTKWQETILYRFRGGAGGANPMSALVMDSSGNLYGTTLYGGTGGCVDLLSDPLGCGTVFQLRPPAAGQTAWTKLTLHHFAGQTDGAMPQARLFVDTAGSVYGTTFQGGSGGCTDMLGYVIGCGTVFKLAPPSGGQKNWTETILHTFTGPEGAFPQGGVIADGTGALIGTTSGGGPTSYGVGGFGVLYRLVPPDFGQTRWAEVVLYNFDISTSGTEPIGELVRDANGHLFGVTHSGGTGYGGTVFEIQ
jgi:hypothetical protein